MIRLGTLASGALGFCMVTILGFLLGKAWDQTLIAAIVASLAFGVMGHWWMTLWLRSLIAAEVERNELESIAAQNAAAAAAEREAEQLEEANLT
tara:strand:- start:6099 stop:6380 length:282 start_codon:yes stop_codon:yes gene_type:complete